jgi:membrane protein required for colicin V production
MNGFDITLAVVALILVVVGLRKGLARLLIGMGALVVAFFLAAQFHEGLAARLTGFGLGEPARKVAAYAVILVGTLIAGAIVAFLVRKLLETAMLGWADRLAGAVLGLAAAMLVAALIVLPLVAYSDNGAGMLHGSRLAPYVTVVADAARWLAPQKLASSYHDGVTRLRSLWRERTETAKTPPAH